MVPSAERRRNEPLANSSLPGVRPLADVREILHNGAVAETRELDRMETTDGDAFARWLYAWKERWMDGERIRVLIALDNSHAVVLEDAGAPEPRNARYRQLSL